MGLFPFFHHSHWIRRCPSSYYHPHPTSNSSCRTVLWRRMRSSSSSTQSSTVSSTKLSPYDEDYFMKQVEATVTKVLRRHPHFHAPTYNALLKTLMRKKKDDTNDNNDEEDDDAATSITNIHTYLNGLKITDIVGPPLTDEDTTANHNNTAKKENSTHKQHREAFGIARHLQKRLLKLRRSGDCPRCWMKREYCICTRCQFETARRTDPETSTADADTDSNRSSSDINSDPGPETSSSSSSSSGSVAVLDRIFVLMHHKEIGMKGDTAKLILGAFPAHGQLVIGGMEDPSDQDSMRILADSIQDPTRTSLILFPHETATTIEDILAQQQEQEQEQQQQQPDATKNSTNTHDHHRRHNNDQYYDLVVLDGTWSQARKLQARYCTAAASAAIRYVQLNPDSVQRLQQDEEKEDDDDDDMTSSSAVSTTRTTGEGGGHGNLHQLRKHTIPWRQVGTFAAFRLFLHEWSSVPTNTTMTTTTATTMATTTATTTTTSTANNQYNNYGTNQHENPYNHRMRNICQTIESYQRISNAAVLREKGRT